MKKKLKGFTLIEVLIALMVFTIMALMLAMIAAVVGRMSYNAKTVNDKVNSQAEIAENNAGADNLQVDDALIFKIGGIDTDIPVKVNEIDGNLPPTDDTPNLKYFTYNP